MLTFKTDQHVTHWHYNSSVEYHIAFEFHQYSVVKKFYAQAPFLFEAFVSEVIRGGSVELWFKVPLGGTIVNEICKQRKKINQRPSSNLVVHSLLTGTYPCEDRSRVLVHRGLVGEAALVVGRATKGMWGRHCITLFSFYLCFSEKLLLRGRSQQRWVVILLRNWRVSRK